MSAAAGFVSGRFAPGGGAHWGDRARLAAAALLFAAEAGRIVGSTPDDFYLREAPLDMTEMRAVEDWIRQHTPEKDIVASYRPSRLYLGTSRRGSNLWTDNEPLTESYGPDRRALTFYAVPDRTRYAPYYRDMRDNLRRVYGEAGIRWYVEYTHAPQTPDLARLVRERPSWFLLRFTTPKGLYRVYEIGF